MNVALRKSMTLSQFLAWEERQELRYEFDGVGPVAMAGGTAAHAAIQRNLIFRLTGRLLGKSCQAYGSELKIQVDGHIRYPEAFVVCTRVPPRSTVVADPVVVFEVLSDGSTHEDLVVKSAEYRATPSIQRYAILQQTHAGATVFVCKGADWITEIVGDQGTLHMPEIGIEIPLAEIYADIELAGQEDESVAG